MADTRQPPNRRRWRPRRPQGVERTVETSPNDKILYDGNGSGSAPYSYQASHSLDYAGFLPVLEETYRLYEDANPTFSRNIPFLYVATCIHRGTQRKYPTPSKERKRSVDGVSSQSTTGSHHVRDECASPNQEIHWRYIITSSQSILRINGLLSTKKIVPITGLLTEDGVSEFKGHPILSCWILWSWYFNWKPSAKPLCDCRTAI